MLAMQWEFGKTLEICLVACGWRDMSLELLPAVAYHPWWAIAQASAHGTRMRELTEITNENTPSGF